MDNGEISFREQIPGLKLIPEDQVQKVLNDYDNDRITEQDIKDAVFITTLEIPFWYPLPIRRNVFMKNYNKYVK